MKKIIVALFLCFSSFSFAQHKWVTNSGSIRFEASVPFFEEIKGQNNKVTCVLNTKKSTIFCEMLISEFDFKRDLMKSHFNDNYMESDRFPRASFRGVIDNLDITNVSTKAKEVFITGKINIHGKSKDIKGVKALIRKENNAVYLQSDFVLNTDDFSIDIPMSVLSKISKMVKVHLDIVLE